MKRIFSIIITIVLLYSCMLYAFAAGNTLVYSDKAVVEKNTISLIPVKIKNNTGIMGFRITVKSIAENVKVVSVKRGEIAKTGNFNTSFGNKDDEFDVLWNSTEEIKDDGTLFIVGVKTDNFFERQTLELSYTEKDTFNGKFEDVSLTCENIEISCVQGVTTKQEEITEIEKSEKKNSFVGLTDEQIVDGVKLTLQQINKDSLDSIKPDDREKFVEMLNKNLQTMTNSTQNFYSNFQEAKLKYNSAYKSFFVDKVLNSAKNEDVKSAIEYALEKNNLKSINDLNEKNEVKFLKDVEKSLQDLNQDIPSVSDDVDSDTGISAVKKLYGGLALTESSENNTPPESSNYTLILIIVLVSAALAILIIVLVRKMRPKGEKN